MKKIFEPINDLDIREELVSIHSLNPFVAETSSARSYMYSSHFSQTLVIKHGDEKIIQTGLEKQFGENTFAKIADKDYRVIKAIKRYNGIGDKAVNKVVETLLIVEDVSTSTIDFISIPYYHKLHQYFGFKYKKNDEILSNLRTNDYIQAGTVLADSPTIGKNKGYKFGVNANVALINIPEVTEDGVIISKRLQEKMAYDIFETRTVEFGSKSFPLNIYGDENNYKSFPEIGELINQDSVLMSLREYDDRLAPATLSTNDVREYDPVFDKTIYVKAPGEIKVVNGEQVTYGEIVDIKVYTSPKYKKDLLTNVDAGIEKYANSLRQFYREIIETYEELKKEHWLRYQNNNLPISEQLHKLIVDAYAIGNVSNEKISYSNRNELLDSVRIEFTIAYHSIVPVIGSKITDGYGSKGVVVGVWDNDRMPYTMINGEKVIADVIMDPASVISRLNPGRIYEQEFNGITRKTQYEIRKVMNYPNTKYTKQEVEQGWNILLGLLQILGTEQYDGYRSITDEQSKVEILKECLEDEVYILYKVSSKTRPYQVVEMTKGTIYQPEVNHVHIPTMSGEKITKDKILIAPIYTMLLFKTAENYLSVAGAKLNHFSMPIGVGPSTRNFSPYRNSPVKAISETGGRLFASYVSRYALAELKDRANNVETHKEIYNAILNADNPTNIDKLIDRKKTPYGGDSALKLVDNIFNSAGFETIEK